MTQPGPLEPAFTYRHLAVLVAVSEMRSITKAAEQLHLTPSAVSTSISELERRLGTPLTIRLRQRRLAHAHRRGRRATRP